MTCRKSISSLRSDFQTRTQRLRETFDEVDLHPGKKRLRKRINKNLYVFAGVNDGVPVASLSVEADLIFIAGAPPRLGFDAEARAPSFPERTIAVFTALSALSVREIVGKPPLH